ncbi:MULTISPECIES: hypothetical protein [unclassified Pseudactinotalea]|uniref:hypothetical protein n=1 Tax=unclassified Pseudactinotalea TaxID=2649176 RepID=UPI003C7B7882
MTTGSPRGDEAPAGVPRAQAHEAKEALGAALADEPGVCGLGLGRADDGGWVVVVNVAGVEVGSRIPSRVGATPVLTRVTGTIRAAGEPGRATTCGNSDE